MIENVSARGYLELCRAERVRCAFACVPMLGTHGRQRGSTHAPSSRRTATAMGNAAAQPNSVWCVSAVEIGCDKARPRRRALVFKYP